MKAEKAEARMRDLERIIKEKEERELKFQQDMMNLLPRTSY